MLGAGLQFNRRCNGDDRFYSAAKARRSRSQNLNGHQNHQSQDHLRRAQSDVAVSHSPKSDVRVSTDEPPKEKLAVVDVPGYGALSMSNIQQFLHSVTPSVTAQYLSKTTMKSLKMCGPELQPYFLLGDLWEAFKEWSAYGAGVPLILNDCDSVIQYYVPYLSGIQLYVDPSKSSEKSRKPGEESDGDYFRDSSSDGSSDSEQERGCLNYSREKRSCHCQTSENSLGINRLSLRDENGTCQEGFSSDEGEPGRSQGHLVFEYLERVPPHGREPLADKISHLAVRFPELKTLRSCDLLSSSWISVAWYPIYRIPMGPSLKPLDACFLTYHHLRTPVAGTQGARTTSITCPCETDAIPNILLPVFGLASYKFKSSLWTPDRGCERKLVNSLLQTAGEWLTMRQVHHPDFSFFCRN
ncbi:uncharacterized protein LOC116025704 [Ipomoea triloba]|uniref:uncharacterized protein LOC116025704 n=1 Tax=Ipomoea triloba TaxID=35885 RepID=UPI00125E2431|nr:uncharacterized protein LOC116025704 [Ipomoea triloba]GLL32950.1 uncharacterized protein LOC109156891 [Ipomoea trifida]GMD26669.1 uncharacterized protein LOC109156891 [Ipomoea batatas]